MCFKIDEFRYYKQDLMNRKGKTLDEYCASIERFEDWYKSEYNKQRMSQQTWANVDSSIVQNWVYDLRSTLAISSVTKHIAGLYQFGKFLQKEKIIKDNFCIGVEIPKDQEKTEREYMKWAEAVDLFNAIDNTYEKLMVGLMMFQTYRISEVSSIELKNIDLENNTITVKRKGGKIQTLKVRKVIRDILVERVEYCQSVGHEFLFQSPLGKQGLNTNSIRTIFKKWQTKLELSEEYETHDLRRCACWNLYYNEGLELFKVSKIMNHSNVRTTEIYLKIDMSAINNELGDLDD